MITRKPAQAGVGVGDGSGNRLIYFVRQGGGQLSHRVHPADPREIRVRLAQLFFRMLALKALRVQRLVGFLKFLNCCLQVIARALQGFCGTVLRGAQSPHKQRRHKEHYKSWYLFGFCSECVDWWQEVIIEEGSGDGGCQQPWSTSAEPRAE